MPNSANSWGNGIRPMGIDPALIRELAAKAKVLGLAHDPELSALAQQTLERADQQERLLTPDELHRLGNESGVDPEPLQQLQNQAETLVDQARTQLLAAQPQLVEPGGALYPEPRAEACWRDCFHFLRVCCYAAAAGKPQFTDPHGMAALGELYAALGVPVDGLLLALHNLQQLSTRAYAKQASSDEVMLLEQAFVELQNEIKGCVITSC